MRRAFFIAAVVAMIGAPPALGTRAGAPSASDFIIQVAKWKANGQFGRYWLLLHPRYRAITTRAFWESCQAKAKNALDGSGAENLRYSKVDEYDDQITLPLLGHIKVRAVTVRLTFGIAGTKGDHKLTETVYVARNGNGWWGLWRPADYRAYSQHRCPA